MTRPPVVARRFGAAAFTTVATATAGAAVLASDSRASVALFWSLKDIDRPPDFPPSNKRLPTSRASYAAGFVGVCTGAFLVTARATDGAKRRVVSDAAYVAVAVAVIGAAGAKSQCFSPTFFFPQRRSLIFSGSEGGDVTVTSAT